MLEDMTNDLNHSNYEKLRTSLILDPFDHTLFKMFYVCKDFTVLSLFLQLLFYHNFQVLINRWVVLFEQPFLITTYETIIIYKENEELVQKPKK